MLNTDHVQIVGQTVLVAVEVLLIFLNVKNVIKEFVATVQVVREALFLELSNALL